MAGYIPDQQIDTGNYVQQTPIFDVSQLYEVDVKSPEFKELLVRLYQQVNNVILSLNNKESGFYVQEEFVTGQLYFNPNSTSPLDLRPVFRKEINIGPLGPGATVVAHGLAITNTWKFTHIYGAASDTIGLQYFPLPYASPGGAANISLSVNVANILITNNTGVAFTDCYVTLEYVKL